MASPKSKSDQNAGGLDRLPPLTNTMIGAHQHTKTKNNQKRKIKGPLKKMVLYPITNVAMSYYYSLAPLQTAFLERFFLVTVTCFDTQMIR